MKRMLFNATYAEELRVAAVEGQKLINFDIETTSKEQRRGNIYKGYITRIEPSLEACFVDYGTEKQGFMPFKEIDYCYLPEINGQKSRDFSKIPVGTELIIQVEKDERGNKGAALTSYVTLPGRYLVLMPNNSRSGGISRRIEGEEREELKALMSQLEIPQGMSVILRTAALGRVAEELQWDLTYLLKLWSAIKTASIEQNGAFLIYQESSLVIRSIRDHFSPDISEVLIDTDEVYNQARQFMTHVMPNFADRIKLYRDDVPLFSRFQIEHQIESAYSRTVNLPSGGAIVIDHTEALTSVDVNSAKANKGADIETTAFLTNIEAAEETARQLRLRDLGGLVVVDFIDMENPINQRELENHFKSQLGLDRARIQMGKLSKFGLLELSRQRLQASLDESSAITCPRCAGVGTIRGIESSALHVLRIIEEEAVKNSSQLSALHVQLPVDVATYLLNERRDDVAQIENRMKVKIFLIPNIHLDSPNYRIKKLTSDSYESSSKSSYNLVEIPEDGPNFKPSNKKSETNAIQVPVVKNISTNEPAPKLRSIKTKSIFDVVIKKISDLFKSTPPAVEVKATNGSKTNTRPYPSRNMRDRTDNNHQDRPNKNSPAQNKDSNPSANVTGGNKSRPVQVNKSNNRIQTVRPVQNVNTVKPSESYQAAPKPERNNRNTQVRQQSQPRPEVQQGADNNPAVIKEEVSQPRQHPRRNHQANKATSQSDALPLTAIPASATNRTSANAVSGVKNISADMPLPSNLDVGIIKIESRIDNTNVAKAKDVHVIPEKFAFIEADLGSLQMVATKNDLLNQPQPEFKDVKRKHYNDLVFEERTVDISKIDYELVETKH